MAKRPVSRAAVDPRGILSDAILETITDGICAFDRDWNFVYANESCSRLTGKTREELIGRNLWEVFGTPPDSDIRQRLTAAANAGTPVQFETFHPGIRAWVSVHAYPGTEGISVYIRDVTREHDVQDRLRASEARFRALVEKSWDGLALVDAGGRFLWVSPSVTRMLGYAPEELVGRPSGELIAGNADERKRAFEAIVQEPGASVTDELSYLAKDGSVRWLETVRTNLLEEPAVRAIVANFRDVTEKRKVNEALRAAVRTRDEVLAVVSHDLRNPLNAISLVTQVLHQPDLRPDDVRKQLATIQRLTIQMRDLIRDLLDVASIDSGGIRIDRSREDLSALAHDAIAALQPQAAERGIRIEMAGLGGRIDVFVDRKRIQQVIANLVANAIKFTPADGSIVVRAVVGASEVTMSVSDTGRGIPAQDLEHVFDRYWRGRQDESGVGLGLAIAKGLVEAGGGRIWAESEEGRGTTVHFTMPVPPRAAEGWSGDPSPTVH